MSIEKIRTEKLYSSEEGKNFELEYYLISKQHSFINSNINYMCYGVEVRLHEDNISEYCEIESTDELYSSKDRAIDFLNKLADGLVTPCTLKDVLSDTLIEELS